MYVLFSSIQWASPINVASGKTHSQKITHSGDSQPPAMREKSTMFLWNK
ncbi:hypothetical protein SB96558_5000 [Shigella boydii 965-58]|nr:hypothetical protein SB96558_5000 [Shigella boydii 965-58]